MTERSSNFRPRREAPRETPENLIVGRNAVREALRAGRDMEKLLVSRGEATGSLREILALAREKGEPPFLVVLDGITDPHNLGAIVRTAECMGAHGVILPERRAVGLTPAAMKAAAGALEWIKVARVTNLTRALETLKAQNVWTYATDMDGEDYRRVNFSGGCALVIGAEGQGVSRLVRETCDQVVSIPMKGHIDSLNASVAAGVILAEIARQRG